MRRGRRRRAGGCANGVEVIVESDMYASQQARGPMELIERSRLSKGKEGRVCHDGGNRITTDIKLGCRKPRERQSCERRDRPMQTD